MTFIKHIGNISEHFLELERRVSKVRFARIEASKRLKRKGIIYNTIISFYSILITVIAIIFSIVKFDVLFNPGIDAIEKFSKYQTESVIILGFSSFITMFTLFFSNRNYSERAAKYQSNYMELTRLLADIQNLMVYYKLQNYEEYKAFKIHWEFKHHGKDLEKRLAKKYKLFADKYAALLTQSENHDDIDYKRACLDEIEDEIANAEKKYFGNIILNNERSTIMLDSSNNVIGMDTIKETMELASSKQDDHIPMELKKLYEKESYYSQKIFEAKIISFLKYIVICLLPLIILFILDFFRNYLEFIHKL